VQILAIDLAKQKSVAGGYDTKSDRIEYRTVATTPQSFHDLLAGTTPDRVVIEVGPQAGWVFDLVTAMDIEIEVANPSHEAWRWRKVKSKTDRKDTLKLARLSASNQLPTIYMPSREVRQWRELIQYRQSLIARRTRIKNSIRSTLTRACESMPTGASGWTKQSLGHLHELAVIDDGQLWRVSLAEDLQQLALLGLRHNPWMREVYERVRRGKETNKKIAIVAVARRLMIRCWAMLRDETQWREPSRVALRLVA
jgi:transposase